MVFLGTDLMLEATELTIRIGKITITATAPLTTTDHTIEILTIIIESE